MEMKQGKCINHKSSYLCWNHPWYANIEGKVGRIGQDKWLSGPWAVIGVWPGIVLKPVTKKKLCIAIGVARMHIWQ